MKKLLCILLTLSLSLFTFCVLAEEAQESDVLVIGEGAHGIGVIIMVGEEQLLIQLNTDKDNLMDALLEHEVIEVEQVSWGYNVTTVAMVKAGEFSDTAYWHILEIKTDSSVEDLAAPIEKTPIVDNAIYAFVLQV